MTLAASDISVRISNRQILDRVSVSLAKGETLGLIGANGVGKSTLLRVMAGINAPDAGQVECDGQRIAPDISTDFAKLIAYLPQDNQVYWPVTVRTLVTLGRMPHTLSHSTSEEKCDEIVEKALKGFELTDLADRTVKTLSGGERARALIARAFAQDTPFLLADEPTSGLDPTHQLEMFQNLRSAVSEDNKGVLLVLHDLQLAARFCDRLVLLSHGKVVAEGSPQAVLTKDMLAKAYGVDALIDFEREVPLIAPLVPTHRS